MDQCHGAQDVMQCHLCDTPDPPMYCDVCHVHLCKACVGEHLSDELKEHKVVSLKRRGSTTACPKHSANINVLFCTQCDIPICATCASSEEHQGHRFFEISKIFDGKKEVIQRDLQELEKFIYPKFQEIASYIPIQRADWNKNSQKLLIAINEHGENLRTEIDIAIKRLKSELDEISTKQLDVLNKQENEIKGNISEIIKSIADLKKLLNSNDASLVSGYKSKNDVLKELPSKIKISLPIFTPLNVNQEHIYQQFGSLSTLSQTQKEIGNAIKSPGILSPFQYRMLIDKPQVVTEINTEQSVSIVASESDDEVWVSWDKYIRLFNLQGELKQLVQTKSGNVPSDIAVTRSGDLVYTDKKDKTFNMVKGNHIEEVVRLKEWKPLSVCKTVSNDLLVSMEKNDEKQSRVVRYSGKTEIQCIQNGGGAWRLYSSGGPFAYFKQITENGNLDICVADGGAGGVVVVDQAGKFRFKYTGPSFPLKEAFVPLGITTDSQCQILTVDLLNFRIHILDQDGNFIRYIDNCDLCNPGWLCMDSRGYLLVTEGTTGKVKKIKYSM
nr:tripartite motif-containing protein 2-like [Crassostrea gigas]